MNIIDILAKNWPGSSKKDIDATSDQSATSQAFHDKLAKVASNLGVDASDLLRIMHYETEGQMRPDTQRNGSNCVGLIQFCPVAQDALHTTAQALAKMTAVQQLDYVEKFYKLWKLPKGADLGTLYMATFLPLGLHKPDNFPIGVLGDHTMLDKYTSKDAVYRSNPSFRVKGRTYFTVGDVKEKIHNTKFY